MIIKAKISQSDIQPLSSYKVWTSYFYVALHPCIWPHLFSYLRTVLCDFFFLQFAEKFGLRKIKIINVDHPLDEEVPFLPEKIDTYLDFVNFWIRPLSLLVKQRPENAPEYFCRYLDLINTCYVEAATFYKFRMTTTKRPAGFANLQFFIVKLLDPHYLCVPSLHVSVMILACTFFKEVFKQEQFTQEEQLYYNEEMHHGALEIAETVLYIKQHSVNCIASALYMMNIVLKEKFTIQDAVNFINAMFSKTDEITPKVKQEINEYLNYLFEQLLLEGINDYDWITPLKRWILSYEVKNNS